MSDIMNPPTFGSQLRKARIEAGLTLRSAATELGVDAGNFSKLENNRLAPPRSEKQIRRLFRALNEDFSPDLAIHLAFSFHLGALNREFFK